MLESLFQLAGPVQALCATLMTWALTSLGACVVFLLRKPNRNVMDAMLGLAGGVMVAASFWSLLSPCIDMAGELGMRPWSTALIGFMGGGFLLFLGDRAFTHFSQKREAAGKNGQSAGFKRCAMLVFSITLHNIPEGLAIGVAVARQFFCETRTEFLRKNSPFLRTKSETRSLASKATKTYRLLMQSSGEFNTPGGAVNPLLPLLFLPLLHAILGALFLGRQILGNRDDIHFRELLDVTLSVFHENGVDRDHILLNFHLFCPPSSFATLFSRAAFCSARLAISS